ncbi:MAG: hypothetical protein WCH98_20095 [Verrucomicrobiota bacterium]
MFVMLPREARLKTRESSSGSRKKAPGCTKKDMEKIDPVLWRIARRVVGNHG